MRVTLETGSATFEFLSIEDGANGQNGGQLIDTYTIEKAPPVDRDYYSLNVSAGQRIILQTMTPAGVPSQFADLLYPKISLYDPTGALVAVDDNGAVDGRNAQIGPYTAVLAGSYTIVVEANDGTGGEYYLEASVDDAAPGSVAGRHVFYNNSFFDDPTFGNDDDTAIDPSKSALLPGQTATQENYVSYSRGINGIMIDIANLAKTPEASDFQFHDLGRDGNAETVAPPPDSITVRPGEGVGGSDRVTLTWDTSSGAVFDTTWLRVTAGTSLGMNEPDVFYFGSAPGEGSGGSDASVDGSDEIGARNNAHVFGDLAPVDDAWDYNKDGLVDGTDQIFARNNQTGFADRLELFSAPLVAPVAAGLVASDDNTTNSIAAPTAAALVGSESGWSRLGAVASGSNTSTGGRSTSTADERIWAEEDEEVLLAGALADGKDPQLDEAHGEDADWLGWDVL
jgi:hypothetical protein